MLAHNVFAQKGTRRKYIHFLMMVTRWHPEYNFLLLLSDLSMISKFLYRKDKICYIIKIINLI